MERAGGNAGRFPGHAHRPAGGLSLRRRCQRRRQRRLRPGQLRDGPLRLPRRGLYDSISQTHLTGAAGDASGAVNPYEVEGDADCHRIVMPIRRRIQLAQSG